jgi:hypothetical protein
MQQINKRTSSASDYTLVSTYKFLSTCLQYYAQVRHPYTPRTHRCTWPWEGVKQSPSLPSLPPTHLADITSLLHSLPQIST